MPSADAVLQRRDHLRRELEAQEVHRRGLLLVLALEVLVGDRVHLRRSPRPAPRRGPRCPSACASAARRSSTSSYSISIVALKLRAVGDQRVVGVELVLDARLLEGLLDPQHLLDLVAHRELVLEEQRHVLAEVDGARASCARAPWRGSPCAPWRRPRASSGFAGDRGIGRVVAFGRSAFDSDAAGRRVDASRSGRRPCAAASADAPCARLGRAVRPMPCSMWRPAIGQSELT